MTTDLIQDRYTEKMGLFTNKCVKSNYITSTPYSYVHLYNVFYSVGVSCSRPWTGENIQRHLQ